MSSRASEGTEEYGKLVKDIEPNILNSIEKQEDQPQGKKICTNLQSKELILIFLLIDSLRNADDATNDNNSNPIELKRDKGFKSRSKLIRTPPTNSHPI
jgi:hypothetical protein